MPPGAEIERLALRHALPPGGLGKEEDKLGANGGIGMRARIAQDLESERQKRIADEDGCRLVEGDVKRRAAAADRVIVHGRQVVMHQRVAVDAFERGRGGQGLLLADVKQSRRFDEQKRP